MHAQLNDEIKGDHMYLSFLEDIKNKTKLNEEKSLAEKTEEINLIDAEIFRREMEIEKKMNLAPMCFGGVMTRYKKISGNLAASAIYNHRWIARFPKGSELLLLILEEYSEFALQYQGSITKLDGGVNFGLMIKLLDEVYMSEIDLLIYDTHKVKTHFKMDEYYACKKDHLFRRLRGNDYGKKYFL